MPVKRKARKQDKEREEGGRRNKWKQLKEVTSEQEVKKRKWKATLSTPLRKPNLKEGRRGVGRKNLPESGELWTQQKNGFQFEWKYPSETKAKEAESVNPWLNVVVNHHSINSGLVFIDWQS